MTNKLNNKSKKYLILPVAILGMVAILAWSAPGKVSAFTGTKHKGEFAAVIAQRFGLDQTQVEETIQQFHSREMETRLQEMRSRFAAKLQTSVAQGNLTETQRQAILEKHDEMEDKIQDLHDQELSPEDFRELRADIHDEMQAWAQDQGIDFDVFLGVGKDFRHRSLGNHMGW
jgi:hypothetical protein